VWPGNEYDHHNFLLTQAIHRAAVLAKTNAPVDRGLKRARFKVLRLANSPSVLVEGGFLSNPGEANALRTEAYRQQVAAWVFEGIQAYKRSQESPEAVARLKLATNSNNSPTQGAVLSTNHLGEIPGFRPKNTNSNLVSNPQAGSAPIVKTNVGPEIRKALPVSTERKE
jgi:hypothetical protein